ncbi:hydrogenase maturation protease [Mycobacterium sp. BK086]|uniref:hydrogenase maturation protease n=1 Tax=Mycobacterium sp. BK086 TaxID=2512165 RepID=UPI00105DCED7|nr:hydrogenase maturation protease [Mycobacterium sp. BK086]TDO17343.1 hydrogenase maturation protease [Mycobacterium sp. BK086]
MIGGALVIGIGNDVRGDDGVGLAVAAGIAERHHPGVEVLSATCDPATILDAWTGLPLVVAVDAASGPGAVPGRIGRWTPGEEQQPSVLSSHSLGLQEVYALGQALGRLPQRLVVFTVEIEGAGYGVQLTAPVAAAVSVAVEAVLAEIQTLDIS